MKKLTMDNIDFFYPGRVLLKQASLSASAGTITGILGSNGSGKTTLFDLLCGTKTAQAGEIRSDFISVLYLSQSINTSPVLRMFDIFKMVMNLASSRQISKQNVLDKLERWRPQTVHRFEEIWNKKSSICSYGEKRWFFATSLLALEAEFLILDEPTAGVDPEFRYYMWECIKGAANDGMAILASSHAIEEISTYCSNFYLIHQQNLLCFKTTDEFLNRFGGKTLDEAFIAAALERP